jgi:hypothetical protein
VALKRYLLAVACGLLVLSLTACGPSTDDSQSNFYVSQVGQAGVSGYVPQGWGWRPGSKVSIQLWNEPCGPDCATSEWKHLFEVEVDQNGMFGFASNAAFYPVRRSICGDAANGQQTVVFMAKSLTTGKISMRQVPAHLWFTFQPCH